MTKSTGFWQGKRVWLSGHTGFQGAWLVVWLKELGAEVYGFSLEPEAHSLFNCLSGEGYLAGHLIADIRNAESVRSSLYLAKPDVVFHLAGQDYSPSSATDPRSLWETNVSGTLNVLDVVRTMPSIRVIQVISGDSCYENFAPYTPKQEEDPLGGTDINSASKAAVELAVRSYHSLMDISHVSIATCRAGGMIGPGDWSSDHFLPTVIQAIQRQETIKLRCPHAIRPWQAVLDPLAGYLKLAETQWQDPIGFSGAWNFGAARDEYRTTQQLVEGLLRHWTFSSVPEIIVDEDGSWDERPFLQLDSLKAWGCLGWAPRFTFEDALRWTVQGYWKCLTASPKELLNWMKASIFSYTSLNQSAQEIILDEQYLGYAGYSTTSNTNGSTSNYLN